MIVIVAFVALGLTIVMLTRENARLRAQLAAEQNKNALVVDATARFWFVDQATRAQANQAVTVPVATAPSAKRK